MRVPNLTGSQNLLRLLKYLHYFYDNKNWWLEFCPKQLDIELRDTSTEEVQRLIEGLMGQIWPADMGTLTPPFPQMTYKEAMAKYGVDKPDTRFENLVTAFILSVS